MGTAKSGYSCLTFVICHLVSPLVTDNFITFWVCIKTVITSCYNWKNWYFKGQHILFVYRSINTMLYSQVCLSWPALHISAFSSLCCLWEDQRRTRWEKSEYTNILNFNILKMYDIYLWLWLVHMNKYVT